MSTRANGGELASRGLEKFCAFIYKLFLLSIMENLQVIVHFHKAVILHYKNRFMKLVLLRALLLPFLVLTAGLADAGRALLEGYRQPKDVRLIFDRDPSALL